jgi:predicted ribosomally synthesized peptide with SipW-like signal peptide
MRKFSESKRAKIMALAAAGLILGVGGTVTLAAWVDNEWVYGGTGGDEPGVGTSEFIVEQNASSPYASLLGSWQNHPENPGNSLTFGPSDPLALTPGDEIYAPVALRTTTASISGLVDTQAAVPADGVTFTDAGDLLWDNLWLRVAYIELDAALSPPTCDVDFFDEPGAIPIADGLGLSTPFAQDIAIASEGTDYLHFCFEVALPEAADIELDDPAELMGRTVAPAWQFISTSN